MLLAVLLIVLSIVALAFGAMSLTQATLGVGVMIGACWLLMLARIAQADRHHRDTE